jgi:membrane-bound serine protease (ClpP class)
MYNEFMNEALLNPNVAYVVLVLGFMLTVMAVLTPGTGFFEGGALILFILAAWEVFNLPINIWALVVLLLAAIFFVLAFRRTWPRLFLGLSILSMVVGSAFLFQGEVWNQPAVNPILALVASVISGGFMWFATRKALEARLLAPSHSLEGLVGATGEAKTQVHEEGSVQVGGELWSARSHEPIPAGAQVRVVGREGFILEVEAIT